MAVQSQTTNPTSLFWSIKRLDRCIRDCIVRFQGDDQGSDNEANLLIAKMFELRKKIEFNQPKWKIGLKSTKDIAPRTRFTLNVPGAGQYGSMLVENQSRYMALSYPEGKALPEGLVWTGQKVAMNFWRTNDAGYQFIGRIIDDHSDKQYPILHVAHTDNLARAQRRKSVRVDAGVAGQLYPLRRIEDANEMAEEKPGLRCRLQDVSEDGAAILVGGRAKASMVVKYQFNLGEMSIVMCGVVRRVNFNGKTNRSVLHIEATGTSTATRNLVLTWVYNLFGDREQLQPQQRTAV
jgi:c-di-GMP-binding flagellar brake protein YcgR